MSIPYKLVARLNPQDKEAERKIYPVVKTRGSLTFEEICENIDRNSTATRGDVKAVMKAFVVMLIKSLANGSSVKLEDIGFFRAGISSEGAVTDTEFYADVHIKRKYINYQPIGKLAEEKSNFTFSKVSVKVETVSDDEEEWA